VTPLRHGSCHRAGPTPAAVQALLAGVPPLGATRGINRAATRGQARSG